MLDTHDTIFSFRSKLIHLINLQKLRNIKNYFINQVIRLELLMESTKKLIVREKISSIFR